MPIVTGTLIGGMRVDVSAKVKGDYTADDGLALMQVCLDAQPHARPLLLALKALIKQEGFNKVIRLLCLLAWILNRRNTVASSNCKQRLTVVAVQLPVSP